MNISSYEKKGSAREKNMNVVHAVENLPEIYQNIYGHPEYDGETSRKCREREVIIKKVVNDYRRSTGKETIKVLDLGCAQGYYSFTLAEMGCKVDGIDFLDKNIELCNVIKRETGLSCSFHEKEISIEMIEQLEEKSYDLILFFSVVHHITHKRGFAYAHKLFSSLADKGHIVLTELALKAEPCYWRKKLPEKYESWFSNVAFFKELGFFETHLSEIVRPLIIYSNDYCYLKEDFYGINETKKSAYPGKSENDLKRYYICNNKSVLVKMYRIKDNEMLSELEIEMNFIRNNSDLSFLPKLIGFEKTKDYYIVATKICFGRTLREVISDSKEINYEKIFLDVLSNLIELEKRGFYHGDMRAWNICIDEVKDEAFVIDFGAIQMDTIDHILQAFYLMPEYPITVYDAFVALVYDCVVLAGRESLKNFGDKDVYLPAFEYNFDIIPERYLNFFKCFLAMEDCISFEDIYTLFKCKEEQKDFSEQEIRRIKGKLAYAKYLSSGLNKRRWKRRFQNLKDKFKKSALL